MNSVTLSGRIRSEAKISYTQSGTARARFILEVPRARAPSKRDFIPVICWGADAEAIRDFTHLNSRVEIRGEIQTFHRDKDDVWEINVVADWVSFPDRIERKIEPPEGAKK